MFQYLINIFSIVNLQEKFIIRSKELFGNKYTYENVVYVNRHTKVKITCKKHGSFSVQPANHLHSKLACKSCKKEDSRKKKEINFISNAKKIHGNVYDYSNVNYILNNTLIDIICKKHGVFRTTPSSHIHQKTVCPKCTKEIIIKIGSHNRVSNDEFIKRAIKIHGDTYDYSKTFYTGMHEPIIVICKEHGEFTQSKAQNHLKNEFNCPKCLEIRYKEHIENTKITYNEAVEKVKSIHRELIEIYDYSNYESTESKITFICNKNKKHGKWNASLHAVTGLGKKGATGCPVCSMSHGERKILFWLRDNDIEHKWQYRIKKPNLNKKSFYIYDFYLPKLKTIIEFDGRQHFVPVEAWGGIKALEKNKKNDAEKTKFAKKLKLNMFRISYEQMENINEVLNKKFANPS